MGWDNGSPFKTILKWVAVVVVAIIALRLLVWALKITWSIGAFLLFTIGPIIFVGWLTLKLIAYFRRDTI